MDTAHYVGAPPTPNSARPNRSKKLGLAERYLEQEPFRCRPNPLQFASLPSVISAHWLQPLVSLGAKKVLEKEDIWAVAPQDTCDALQERFRRHYTTENKEILNLPHVAVAFLKTFRRQIITIIANYCVYMTAMVLQPFIAKAILQFLDDEPNVFHIDNGYVLVALMVVVSFVGVTCLNYGFFLSSRVGANMRAIAMDIVYRKALRLSCIARQAYTTGEITTLMSVDSERIFFAIINGPWILVAPLAFLVTVVLVGALFDGVSAVCGAALLGIVLYTSIQLADHIGDVQKELLSIAEERVKVTSEALQGIRVMKFYAWEESLANRVERIRAEEIKHYRKFHYLQITNTILLFLTPVFLGGLVMGIYVGMKGTISVTDAYTIINVVNITRLAVNMFPLGVASLSQAAVTYRRMDEYLGSDEVLDQVTSDSPAPGTISVRDAHFRWSPEVSDVVIGSSEAVPEEHIHVAQVHELSLEGVNLEVDAGSLVMIVGSVGAGKSSLLSALLGEMMLVDGSVNVSGGLSYVSQESWIRNATVKENILFEEELDEERYAQVLEATQLTLDLQALPDGDQTEIGERGINLSGGQKARVAIARAVYHSNYDILILDDPLSAVDPHVAHAIFNHCIMGFAKEKTRLLVLNSHYDLLKHADKILVLQDGRIAGDGTYTDISAQFPELRSIGETLDKIEQDIIDEYEEEDSEPPATAVRALAPEPSKAEGNAGLISSEDRVKGRVSGQTYMSYFDETGFNGILVVFTIIMAYFAGQGMRVVVDWWQGHWADKMETAASDPNYSELSYGMWYFGFIVICSVVTIARGLLMMESCIRSSKSLHNELFRRVLQAPINLYFDVTPVGRILNRFSNDLDQMDSVLPQHYQSLFQSLGVLVGCLVVCALASFWVGLSYLPMLAIFVVTGVYFKQTSREVKRLEGVTRSPVFNLFGETLNGLHTIRAFRMQDKFVELNKAAVDDNTSFYFTYWAAGRWLAIRLDWLSVAVIFVVTIYLVSSKGDTDSVVAGISLSYSLMLTSMIQWVVRAVDLTDNAMTSVERLLHFRTIPVEKDSDDCVAINGAAWPARGAIRFDSLCLRYRPDLPLVLRGVDMDIQPGEKVGICGRTGAGKSSLMIALFRICSFDSGSVFIDGIDIEKVRLQDLRRGLAIIPQDPVLYSGTLRDNLDPFGDYTDEAIWSVLQQVHLASTVTKWGTGLSFSVSERGDNLSVGQRQLLCIGRALLKDSRIVVLDEATANVDTATDRLIQATIQETFADKTVLIIAHRINTIMHCNKIAVMDAGRVAEFGAPSSLLQQPDSMFASLATAH
ncbi:ABC transporter C family member 12 [Phytophthora citrophthora]|uniref:ABC transporter C family member 12 n=1 Tax=Phytophthora citrophthora TaxID=4793 RepID=A0AAD9GLH7_9STRA|nr:ABC transporter C family member 12 [Phytophthora citrophthora]